MTAVESAPYTECPRFDRCSVNVCPLDPDMRLRNRLTGEPSCTLKKSVRNRIGQRHVDVLPLAGLTPREASSQRQWERKTAEQRERFENIGRKNVERINRARERERQREKSSLAVSLERRSAQQASYPRLEPCRSEETL